MEATREELESKLGYQFQRRELLQRALTHRSSLEGRPSSEPLDDNEQLEFLGDAVLGFVVSESLVLRFPKATEGQLSRWKAHLVSAAHLHRCALTIGLGDHMLLGRGEDRSGGRERPTLLSDALEALIAALYLDGSITAARQFIETNILQYSSDLDELSLRNNQKVELQNKARALGLPPPRYSVVAEEGPDHAKVFEVEARVGNTWVSRAKASTKRTASLLAAKEILEQLQASGSK
jgi:ribonuclease-3